jgi:Rrf2 family protein
MKLSEGVEWTAHACLLLSILPPGVGLAAKAIAEFHDLAPAYMAKHLQALTRAGIVETSKGPGGGYRLARAATEITLLDIADAIEGREAMFRCSEIRRKGPCISSNADFRKPCHIASTFARADSAWRSELRMTSIAEIAKRTAENTSAANRENLIQWMSMKLGKPFALAV